MPYTRIPLLKLPGLYRDKGVPDLPELQKTTLSYMRGLTFAEFTTTIGFTSRLAAARERETVSLFSVNQLLAGSSR